MSKIKKITKNSRPYFIAEIGFNHLGKYSLAAKMVRAAKKAGADAVKFQTYLPDEMVFKRTKHYKILKNTELKLKEYLKIKLLCKKLKIDFITTPFDIHSVKKCQKIGFDAIKIASMDLNNHMLIEEIKKLKKPIILSTGMSSIKEINTSLKLIDNTKIFLLHCVSNYPTQDAQSDLFFINRLKKINNWRIGFSDHTISDYSSIAAVSIGAKIIEKHFTFDRKIKGADNLMSYDTFLLKNLILKSNQIYVSLKDKTKRSDERNKIKMRRFFFYSKNLKKNHKIKNTDLKTLRVEEFKKKLLSVDTYKNIIFKKLNKDVSVLQPVLRKDLQ